MKNVLVGISGASGAIFGLKALDVLSKLENVNTHLIVTEAGMNTVSAELGNEAKEKLISLAGRIYENADIGSSLASGSSSINSMIIAPCSINTMSSIASGITSTLISRAADVMLKERRRLVLMVREAPFHSGHLRSMLAISEMGGIISPPVPAMYLSPSSLDEMVEQTVFRNLELLGLNVDNHIKRWHGIGSAVLVNE